MLLLFSDEYFFRIDCTMIFRIGSHYYIFRERRKNTDGNGGSDGGTGSSYGGYDAVLG